jgi:hypothetical protein
LYEATAISSSGRTVAGAGFNPAGLTEAWVARLACLADIFPPPEGDGVTNVDDLLFLIGAWGPCPDPCPPDLDGDGAVELDDLLILLGAWGC